MNLRNSAEVMILEILNGGVWRAGWRGGLTKFKKQVLSYRSMNRGGFKIVNEQNKHWHSGKHWRPPGVPSTYRYLLDSEEPWGWAFSGLGPLTLHQCVWKYFTIVNKQYGRTSEVLVGAGVGGAASELPLTGVQRC